MLEVAWVEWPYRLKSVSMGRFDGWNDEDKAKAVQKGFRHFNR